MSIKVSEIKKILIQKNIHLLYHVNTVTTAITFLESGGLLSRGLVEDKNKRQTKQDSDAIDKKFGIYYDIFFDSVDIHERSHNLNYYGPITFVYSIDILDTLENADVRITKDNPIRWEEEYGDSEKYFTDLKELKVGYRKGEFQQHLTIHNIHEPVSFIPHLRKIIIDNPQISNNKYFEDAYKDIKEKLESKKLNIPLEDRKCPITCKCRVAYKEMNTEKFEWCFKNEYK